MEPTSAEKRKTRLITGVVCSLIFAALCLPFLDYVMDDAFITFRLAQNLAATGEIVWNPGGERVEGYTSFWWLLINAAGIRLGLDPVWVSKAVSLTAALAIIWGLAYAGRDRPWWLCLVFAGGVGASPVFAFHAMQGLETVFTAALLLGAAWTGRAAVLRPGIGNAAWFFLFAILAFGARPDTAPYIAGAVVTAAILVFRGPGRKSAAGPIAIGLAALALAGAYWYWRWRYFGLFFPTSYYLKVGGDQGIPSWGSMLGIVKFVLFTLLPYPILIFWLWRGKSPGERVRPVLPSLIGCAFFILSTLAVTPVQGFLERFIYPAYPALLFCLASMAPAAEPGRPFPRRKFSALVLVAVFWGWSLASLPRAMFFEHDRASRDRIVAGKLLAGLDGVMMSTESGAVPYYSGWESYDHLGLSCARVAREGLTLEFLDSIEPDLVLVHVNAPRYGPYDQEREIIDRYLRGNNFAVVAAIEKCEGQHNYYFARRDSRLFGPISDRLLGTPGLVYGDLDKLMSLSDIPRAD